MLMSQLTNRLLQVNFTAPSHQELEAIFLASQLFIPDRLNMWSLFDKNELVQKTCLYFEKVRTNPDIVLLVGKLKFFNDSLKGLGFEDF